MKIELELELEDEILTGKEIYDRLEEFAYSEFIPVSDLKKGNVISSIIVDNIYYVAEHPKKKFYIILNGDMIIKKVSQLPLPDRRGLSREG